MAILSVKQCVNKCYSAKVTFSILHWNIWFYNQIDDLKLHRLLSELQRFTDQYKPDYIALNEVAQASQTKSVEVLDFLEKHGYPYNHYAHPAQLNEAWRAGAAFCSRLVINRAQDIMISPDSFAAQRGYPDFNKEAIGVDVTPFRRNQHLKIIVAHPLALIDTPKAHYVAIKNLNKLVHSSDYAKNTIMIGDMNEWRLIPRSLRSQLHSVMYSRTGSLLHPTWRYNAHRYTPIRANLDYVYWSKQSEFKLKDFKVLASNASDHRPLLATFESL